MQARRKHRTRRYTKFFRIGLSHETLGNFFQVNFALMQYHKYSLTELDNMLPWERQIYIDMLVAFLEQERERLKAKK